MKNYEKIVIIIPALNPDEKLLHTLKDIYDSGFCNVILVNDGSNINLNIFEEAKALYQDKIHILKHSVNLGQGRAFKTAFNYYIDKFKDSVGVVECDADGQHHIDDIVKCADLLLEHPDWFILGVRNFDDKSIPFRSRFGNKCTSAIFRFLCGINISDTQTGLKGVPYELTKILIETYGESFEYATSILLELSKREIPIHQFDIQTIYINDNESSHFNPVLDSVKIYSVILKYMCSSLMAVIIDYGAFILLSNVCSNIFVLTYVGRLLSAICNFTVNKKLVFKKKGNILKQSARYLGLLLVSGTISALAVSGLSKLIPINLVIIKIIVETILFFFNFYIQNNFVFKKND